MCRKRNFTVLTIVLMCISTPFLLRCFAPTSIRDMIFGLPEVVQGLPRNFKAASIELESRIRTKFPIGSDVEIVTNSLLSDGFRVNREQNLALFSSQGCVCALSWRIYWEVDANGKIKNIQGRHGGACL